ncbi:MAG: ParB/RepB/Spo0J family partition protein [Deltaproteobacteria bacterium]
MEKRRGWRLKKVTLGKGLNALIPTAEKEDFGYLLANIEEVKPNSFQPRKEFDESAIENLAASIKENGILQPLVVRKSKNGYEIIAGERRWRAAQLARLKQIPVIIKDVSDREALELALVENLQREDLNPIEEAVAYEQLIQDFGLTHDEISKRIGKDRSTITNQLRLLKLPDEVKKSLLSGQITAGHARAILSLHSAAAATEALSDIVAGRLSVRKTEQLIQGKVSARNKGKSAKAGGENFYLDHFAESLKKTLGTKVKIIDRAGRGKIEIEYYSKAELERLLEMLSKGSK